MNKKYHIIKASRIYKGYGYSGPACDKAGVPEKKLYDSLEKAQVDAKKLSSINPVGFIVVEAFVSEKTAAHHPEE